MYEYTKGVQIGHATFVYVQSVLKEQKRFGPN